jgi:hypothetical protein
MKYALFVVALLGMGIRADAKEPVYKSWKIFKSDVGYQFKYPDCWEIRIDSPDEEGSLEKVRNIAVDEGPSCVTKQLYKSVDPNGIGMTGGYGPKRTRSEAVKEIEFRERSAPGGDLVFKHFKLGDTDAIAWVEHWPIGKYIRWQTKVYCSDWWISITGPAIDELNVDKAIYAKFKKGDLALPEPYNTIINSIRCIPAKQKEDLD